MFSNSSLTPPTAQRAFTLMEVLVATGIFAVGMVAVASIFPVAILLQKRTVEAINADAFADNAKAMVETRGFDERILDGVLLTPPARKVPDKEVWPVPEAVNGNNGTNYEWAAIDRSFGLQSNAADRGVWWVPLFFDAADDNPLSPPAPPSVAPETTRLWKVFVFVVRRSFADGTVYGKPGTVDTWAVADAAPQADPDFIPGVAKIAVSTVGNRFNFTNTIAGDRLVRVGDQVLAEDGAAYRIYEADASGIRVKGNTITNSPLAIWAAHPGNSGESAYVALLELSDDPTNQLNQLIR